MASSTYINSNSLYGRYVQFKCEQISVDPATNKSTVKWTLSTVGANGSSVSVSAITCKINGVTVASYGRAPYTTHTFPAYGEQSVSGTIQITHDTGGTKSVNVSLAANYEDTYSPIEQTKSWTLNPIPQTASITRANDFYSNQNPSFQYSNPLGDSVSALQVAIHTGTTGTPIVAYRDVPKTGFTMGFALTGTELADLMTATTGTSMTVYYWLKTTLNGVDTIDTEAAAFSMYENAATKPSVSVALTPYNGSLPSAFNGKYIQGLSQLDVAVTAAGKYGATISSYSTLVNGTLFSGASFRTDTYLPVGSQSISTTVIDSRGFSGTASANITVFGYSNPELRPYTGHEEILLYRSDNSGNMDNTQTQLWLSCACAIADIDGTNTGTLKIRTRQSGASTWGSWSTLTITSGAYNALVPGTFAITNAYEAQVQLTDTIGQSDVVTFFIPTEDIPLHLGPGGTAVGIGRYAATANPYSVSIGWKAYFDDDIYVLDNNQYVPLPLLDIATIMNAVYPVGCLYWSADNTNPATVLGIGTWTQITDTFILAAGSTYTPPSPDQYTAQAGEATHSLLEAELPSHTHGIAGDGRFYTTRGSNQSEISGLTAGSSFSETSGTGGVRRTRYTDTTGSGTAHNNMPPYLVRYCWQRTA